MSPGTQRQYAHAGDELSRTLHEHGVAIRERDFYRNQYDLAKQMRKDVRGISDHSRLHFGLLWDRINSSYGLLRLMLLNPFSDPRQRMDVRESWWQRSSTHPNER